MVAVTLGGSRAGGVIHPDSDWDFGLYYRDAIRADDVRGLGFDGTVVEPGAWGRLVNGGAGLTVEDQRVDLLYRDLDIVQHWLDEAEAGRYEIDQVEGYLAGIATYVLVGELALAELLAGELPRPGFPTRFGRPPPGAGGAAPASHSRSPTRRRRPVRHRTCAVPPPSSRPSAPELWCTGKAVGQRFPAGFAIARAYDARRHRRVQPPSVSSRPGSVRRRWAGDVADLQVFSEADAGTRTPDPLLTMEVLYQLSYVGVTGVAYGLVGGAGFEPA
jgi:hypothetical protein